MGYFCNTKDPTPTLNRSNVVYEFSCPGCRATYIGKTERTLFERSREHGWSDKKSAVYTHLLSCEGLSHIDTLMSFPCTGNDVASFDVTGDDIRFRRINIVRHNLRVIDKSDNWSVLLIKEALAIKDRKPLLNSGLKASRDLRLF